MRHRKRQRQLERAKRAQQQQAAAANPGPAIAPPVPAVVAADETPERSGGESIAQEQPEGIGPEGPRWYLLAQTFVGVGLLLFTAGQMYYGYWQWDATNKQYDIMRADQRPWLEIKMATSDPLRGDSPVRCTVLLHNSGRTPAFFIDGGIAQVAIETPQPGQEVKMDQFKPIDPKTIDLGPHGFRLAIAPDSEIDYTPTGKPIPADVVKAIEDQKAVLTIGISAVYLDNSGKVHNTISCFAYIAEKKRFVPYPRYNQMD